MNTSRIAFLRWLTIYTTPSIAIHVGLSWLDKCFESGSQTVAHELATVAVGILQETMRGGGNARGNKMAALDLSRILVQGLNTAVKKGFRYQVTTLLDDRITMFSDAVERGDEPNANSLSEVGVILMTAAIDGGLAEAEIGEDWSITEHLSKSWVKALDRAPPNRKELVETLINRRADEFNYFTRDRKSVV